MVVTAVNEGAVRVTTNYSCRVGRRGSGSGCRCGGCSTWFQTRCKMRRRRRRRRRVSIVLAIHPGIVLMVMMIVVLLLLLLLLLGSNPLGPFNFQRVLDDTDKVLAPIHHGLYQIFNCPFCALHSRIKLTLHSNDIQPNCIQIILLHLDLALAFLSPVQVSCVMMRVRIGMAIGMRVFVTRQRRRLGPRRGRPWHLVA